MDHRGDVYFCNDCERDFDTPDHETREEGVVDICPYCGSDWIKQ